MLRNISYHDNQLRDEINNAVGKSYSLFERIRMGGIGSQRYLITETSKRIDELLSHGNGSNFGNIELRREGLILRFRSRLDILALIVPYKELSLLKSSSDFTLFSGADFVKLQAAHNSRLDYKFINMLVKLQAESQPSQQLN